MDFDRLVVSFLVDEVVGGFFISVPPGHIACVYDRGRGVLPRVWGPGLHLKIPFWQIAKLFNAQIVEYTIHKGFDLNINKEALGDEPIRTTTADGTDILVQGSILFRIDKQNAPELWESIGEHFVSKIIRPISRSRIAALLPSFATEDIRTRRTEIESFLKDEFNHQFEDKGLVCEGVLLSEVSAVKEEGRPILRVLQNPLSANSPTS
jgi:regulator of protease activity HflC (stomatin/prohibitin superfamily)